MDEAKLKKLGQFYSSLIAQQRIYDNLSTPMSKQNLVERRSIIPLESELNQLIHDFPGIIPNFNKSNYYSSAYSKGGELYYDLAAIRTYLVIAISRLESEIDPSTSSPVTEKRQFSFVNDVNLRNIIERDYNEIQRAFIAQCWKSVIILCGGTIEAILMDLIKSNEPTAETAKSAPKGKDITRWDLSDLLDVSVELHLVSASVEKLSHSLREYRNLVHPGNELRNKLVFDAEEAKIAAEILNIIHRDLTK